MPTDNTIIIIIVVVLLAVILGALFGSRKRRSEKLREKFGPEYDYTVNKVGDQKAAEETLHEREKRVTNFNIRTLENTERERYQSEWNKIQADFVDYPPKSVEEANRLISEVMVGRGFPVTDFEQRAEDLSVMYPNLVSNYRNAYAIAMKNQNDGSSTEELRQSMVYYRSLFEELLGNPDVKEGRNNQKEVST